jgi:hypothetical protein
MRFADWLRPPRHVLAIFGVVAIVSASALGWLAWLLLEQDRSLETQRREELLEQATDRGGVVMQAALADLEARMRSQAVRRSRRRSPGDFRDSRCAGGKFALLS